MAIELTAGAADATELPDLDVFAVTFAEHPDGSGWHLSFQRSLNPTPQDVATGLDTYSITTSDGATFYGGVERWLADGHQISLELTDDAAETLGLDGRVNIALPSGASQKDVSAGMRRALSDGAVPNDAQD